MTQIQPRQDQPSGLARSDESVDFLPLDVYAGGLADIPAQTNWIATISAGRKVSSAKGEFPQASRKDDAQHIWLSDPDAQAPGLAEAIRAGGGKQLTVAFPFNDPRQFVHMRFVEYSASALLAYGDERSITVLGANGVRFVYQAGSPEYADALTRCKVAVSVFFVLARWLDDGSSEITFPDGAGFYRLRFTSRWSLKSLRSTLMETARFTGGQIAGIPFEMGLDFPEVSGPDGKKRTIPRWRWLMKPPGGLTSRTWARVIESGLNEGRALHVGSGAMLPPRSESFDDALQDDPGVVIDMDTPSDADLDLMARGGRCDARGVEAAYFALVRGTGLEGDAARARLVSLFTSERTTSLRAMLEMCTDDDAQRFLDLVRDHLEPHAQDGMERVGAATLPAADAPSDDATRAKMRSAWEKLRAAGAARGIEVPEFPEHMDTGMIEENGAYWKEQLTLATAVREAEPIGT